MISEKLAKRIFLILVIALSLGMIIWAIPLSFFQFSELKEFEGVIKPLEASIYMEGTHKLEINEKEFVLLKSKEIDLDKFINKKVEIKGIARKTIEGNGLIVEVKEIQKK